MDKLDEFRELDRQYAELYCRSPVGTTEQKEEWGNQRRAKEVDLLGRMRAIIPNAYPWVQDCIGGADKRPDL